LKHSSRFIVAANEHGDYCIPAGAAHRPAAQRIISGEVWEKATLDYIIDRLGDHDVITAGTFFGDALPALSKATRGTVWAFEPNPESYRCAGITVLMNEARNVCVQNRALGLRESASRLLVREPNGRSLGGLSKITSQLEHSVKVEMTTIDDAVPEDAVIGVLHLDLEVRTDSNRRSAASVAAMPARADP
jgi:FkbM family methyltransferase